MTISTHVRQLHIRYAGESHDVPFADLDIGDLSTDDEVRRTVANFFNSPVSKFNGFVVERNAETGDMTLRPPAVFGC